MRLTVVIPCYNERDTIETIVTAVRQSDYPDKEIIVVDDCSRDGTREKLKCIESQVDKIIYHEVNHGKGAAIRSGMTHATGDIVIIQDADLESTARSWPRSLAARQTPCSAPASWGARPTGSSISGTG